MEVSNGFVCAMGIGTVFVGLVSLVIICWITGVICRAGSKDTKADALPAAATANAQPAQNIEQKQEIIAAVSAAIAEELGTDVSAIRILSFKKM